MKKKKKKNYFKYPCDIQIDELSNVQSLHFEPFNNQTKLQTIWIFDVSASEHLTNNKEILKNYRKNKITLKCANSIYMFFN